MLTKIKGNPKVQAVVNWSIVPAQSIVAKNMKQLGMDMPLFQSHGFGNRNMCSKPGRRRKASFSPPAGCWWWRICRPIIRKRKCWPILQEGLRKPLQGRTSAPLAGIAYDALLVVVEALKKAGEPEREKVRDALETLTGVRGTAGIFNFPHRPYRPGF